MTRRFWWLVLAAASLALGGTRAVAADKAPQAAKPQCGKDCCKNGKCGKDCCTDCPNDCCAGCGTRCCKDGCPCKAKADCPACAALKADNKPIIFFVVLQQATPMPGGPVGVYMPAPVPPMPVPNMPMPAMPAPMAVAMPTAPAAPGMVMPEPIPMCPAAAGMGPIPPPMPLPCPVPAPPCSAPAGKGYVVELKSMEARPGKDPAVCQCPRMMLCAGGDAQCCFDNETVLGKCTDHCAGGCCAKGGCPMGMARGNIHVHVRGEHDGVVDLDVDVQQADVEHGKDGVQVLTKTLHAVRHVEVDRPTRLVLDRCTDGSPCRWIEVTVSPAGHGKGPIGRAPCCGTSASAEALAMPKSCAQECEESATAEECANFWSALGQLIEGIADCVCPGAACAEAIGYDPAGDMPEMMCLPPEMMHPMPAPVPPPTSAAMLPPLPAPEMVLPPPVIRACPAPVGAGLPARPPVQACVATEPAPAVLCLRVTAAKESGLEVCQGDVCMSSKKLVLKSDKMDPLTLTAIGGQVRLRYADLHARADSLSTDRKDIVVLEGHVRLCYGAGDERSDVTASRVEINWSDGSMKIKP
jgi:hypothetical protein